MKVYVSGSIHDRDLVRLVQDGARLRGHEITHDWTGFENTVGRRARQAETVRQLAAIRDADALVVVWNTARSHTGTLMEMGAALLAGAEVVVITEERDAPKTMFDNHPNYKTVPGATAALDRLEEFVNE